MIVRRATLEDGDTVLTLLDEFRNDCIEQISGKPGDSHTAREHGDTMLKSLLARQDYCILLLGNPHSEIVGIITGYLCPMLRNGGYRAEVEEFFVKNDYRGSGNASLLMDAFFSWTKEHHAQKVNLESDNSLKRAHSFYNKYGFQSKSLRYEKNVSSPQQ